MFQKLKKLFPFPKLSSLFSRPQDPSFLDSLEKLLYEADLGASLTSWLVGEISSFSSKQKKAPSQEEILDFFKGRLLSLFPSHNKQVDGTKPLVFLLVGVNGSGKTTTAAKLASFHQKRGFKTLLVAADTFRAGAHEQLALWGEKIGVPLIGSQKGADPASVVFDALVHATSKAFDLVLIDTAGRLDTQKDLMKELQKIKDVCRKFNPSFPHETIFILDANSGQNGVQQAKTFHASSPLSSLIVTKLDSSARGGIALSLQRELPLPILWVGLGEKEHDLHPFDPKLYVEELFSSS